MTYSKEHLDEINQKYKDINQPYNNLLLTLYDFQPQLENKKAVEYLMQGAGRRIKTLNRCIQNIFTIFPPENIKLLSKEKLTDININLHTFFINISGVFDNLAWVFLYENDLIGKREEGKVTRNGVGLFQTETQKHLNSKLNDYLNSDAIKSWYTDYSKVYRDSLAHRIPLYVPPSLLNSDEEKEYRDIENEKNMLDFSKDQDIEQYEKLSGRQEEIGVASHFFADSLNEGCQPAYFHVQVLADFATVEEILEKFIEYFNE